MSELLSSTVRKASKNHRCDGNDQVNKYSEDAVFGCGDIKKGSHYIDQRIKDGGTVFTWRTCPSCLNLIEQNNYWDES